MKIGFVTYPAAFVNIGGLQVQMQQTANYLERAGIEVIFLSNYEGALVGVDCLHVFGAIHGTYKWVNEAKTRNIPVVFSPVMQPHYTKFDILKLKFTFFIANHLISQLPGHQAFYTNKLLRKALIHSNAIVAQTSAEAETLAALYPIDIQGIDILPNGINAGFLDDYEKCDVEVPGRYVFLPGAICRYKNQLSAIKALMATDVAFVLAGEIVDQTYFKEIEAVAGNRLHYAGVLTPGSRELKTYYADAECTILISKGETFGLVAIESLSQGTPVVITHKNGIDINSKWFKQIRASKLEQLIAAVDYFKKAKPSIEECRHLIAKYNWREISAELERLYQRVLVSKN